MLTGAGTLAFEKRKRSRLFLMNKAFRLFVKKRIISLCRKKLSGNSSSLTMDGDHPSLKALEYEMVSSRLSMAVKREFEL